MHVTPTEDVFRALSQCSTVNPMTTDLPNRIENSASEHAERPYPCEKRRAAACLAAALSAPATSACDGHEIFQTATAFSREHRAREHVYRHENDDTGKDCIERAAH
jgi:hypothetical protein